MTSRRSAAAALISVLLILAAAPLRAGEEPRTTCSMCGMWIDENLHTRHVVILRNGAMETFCSLSCATPYVEQKGPEVVSVKAADYGTTQPVDARVATYVLGSDVPPVMSETSTVAFGKRADAEAFRKEHGGDLADFDRALLANRH